MNKTVDELKKWVEDHTEDAATLVHAIQIAGDNGKIELFIRNGQLQDPRVQPQLRLRSRKELTNPDIGA